MLAFASGLVCCAARSAPHAARTPRVAEVRWGAPVSLSLLERISAQVSVLGVHAGEFEFQAAPSCDDALERVELRSTMSTAGVVRFFKATDGSSHTTMSLRSARPITSDLLVIDSGVTRRYRSQHQPGGALTTYERSGHSVAHKHDRTDGDETPLDMPSAFMLLRHWRAARGSRGYFYVLLGKDLWRVVVQHRGVASLPYHGENRRTVLLVGTATKLEPVDGKPRVRHFSLWLTDDAARVPLKLEGDASFGTVQLELVSRSAEPSPRCAALSR